MPKHTHTRRHGVTNKLTPQCFSVITKQPLCCIRRLFIYSIPGLHSSPRPTALKAFQLRPRNSLHHSSILKGQAPLKTKLVCCIRQRGIIETYNDSACKFHDSIIARFATAMECIHSGTEKCNDGRLLSLWSDYLKVYVVHPGSLLWQV